MRKSEWSANKWKQNDSNCNGTQNDDKNRKYKNTIQRGKKTNRTLLN